MLEKFSRVWLKQFGIESQRQRRGVSGKSQLDFPHFADNHIGKHRHIDDLDAGRIGRHQSAPLRQKNQLFARPFQIGVGNTPTAESDAVPLPDDLDLVTRKCAILGHRRPAMVSLWKQCVVEARGGHRPTKLTTKQSILGRWPVDDAARSRRRENRLSRAQRPVAW